MMEIFETLLELAEELKKLDVFEMYIKEITLLRNYLSKADYTTLGRLASPFQHFNSWPVIKRIIEMNANKSDLPQYLKNYIEKAMQYERWPQLLESAEKSASITERLFTLVLSVEPPYTITFLSPKLVRLFGEVQAVLHRSGLARNIIGSFINEGGLSPAIQKLELDLIDEGLSFPGVKRARRIINDFITSNPELKKGTFSFALLLGVKSIFTQLIYDLVVERVLILDSLDVFVKYPLNNCGWGLFRAKSADPKLMSDCNFVFVGESTLPAIMLLILEKRIYFNSQLEIYLKGYFFEESFFIGTDIWGRVKK